jgi:hypothetical protein
VCSEAFRSNPKVLNELFGKEIVFRIGAVTPLLVVVITAGVDGRTRLSCTLDQVSGAPWMTFANKRTQARGIHSQVDLRGRDIRMA